ncbi:hypothetical protein H9P43_002552 [Blastocladiella emersonii ATCC 22665]|nr:hypothetical protein H9P43_002552 [Blastocladiella emersonii ATCC 22665]
MSMRSSLTTFLARGASRKPLTPKGGNKNFYKGTGTGSMGEFIGGRWHFRVNPAKVRQFVVPDLTGFKLKPYVSWAVPQEPYMVTADTFIEAATSAPEAKDGKKASSA